MLISGTEIPVPDLRYMAWSGVQQWARAVCSQTQRIAAVPRMDVAALHIEQHFFVVAAAHFLSYKDWALEFGCYDSVDFRPLDVFDRRHITDLRNMREHMIEYFKEEGRAQQRWFRETPEFQADASSCIGTLIGGRLDWREFGGVVGGLLPAIMAEPMPGVAEYVAAANAGNAPPEA